MSVDYINQHPKYANHQAGGVANGGGGSDDGGMEARVAKLEDTMTDVRERLARIETRLETGFESIDQRFNGIDQRMATKEDSALMRADMERMGRVLIQWFVGTAVALAGIAFAVAKFVH